MPFIVEGCQANSEFLKLAKVSAALDGKIVKQLVRCCSLDFRNGSSERLLHCNGSCNCVCVPCKKCIIDCVWDCWIEL